MSVIFGTRLPKDAAVMREEMLRLGAATERYAPDGTSVAARGRIGMGFQQFRTHQRSNLESQPAIDAHGNILSLDGRIDNHAELSHLLDIEDQDTPDSIIVLTAFLRWGTACFSRLVGDWALALWSPMDQVVYLARDHAGTRSLYFRNVAGILQWSTYLETFFVDGSAYSLDEQYAACYLGLQPIRDLTPYKNIRSVPAAHYLAIGNHHVTRSAHWESMVKERVRYQSDAEYEEHFLSLFRQSVGRRTVPGAPILAELSGGMDSTSIVCISDQIRRSENRSAGLLDTMSFYDDFEPNWDERPYFSIVESSRGKSGIHINCSLRSQTFDPPVFPESVSLIPGLHGASQRHEMELNSQLEAKRYRSILSGIGGDEVLGGVPAPTPELADYLISGNLSLLFKRATEWSLANRIPILKILVDTLWATLKLDRGEHVDWERVPPWIGRRHRDIITSLARSTFEENPLNGVLPTAVANGLAWPTILDTMPHMMPSLLVRYEYRYPFLDRDLVDFLFRIPREQLVRPGRRRSLMRRALKNIVPTQIIERRRKAYYIRQHLVSIREAQEQLRKLFSNSCAVEWGLIDRTCLCSALELTIEGHDMRWLNPLSRAISLELWLSSNRLTSTPFLLKPHLSSISPPGIGADKIREDEVSG